MAPDSSTRPGGGVRSTSMLVAVFFMSTANPEAVAADEKSPDSGHPEEKHLLLGPYGLGDIYAKDSEYEYLVKQLGAENLPPLDDIIAALNRKRGEQTLLIITHRISVCQHADRVFVMQNGRLTAQGPHQALQQQPGFYQELWQIQTGQSEEFSQRLEESA